MSAKIGDQIRCEVEATRYRYSFECPFCECVIEDTDAEEGWGGAIDAFCDDCGAEFEVDTWGGAKVTKGPDESWLEEQEQQD